MERPTESPVTLDELIIEVATSLMGVGLDQTAIVSDQSLALLHTFFGVDHVFLRRNDPKERVSIMVGEQPPREFIPDPDPLAVVAFDSDPVFAALEYAREPMINYPDEHEEYDKRIEKAAGGPATYVGVPLLNGSATVGTLGLIRYGMRRWTDEEVRALTAIATMFAQLWGRVEAESEVVHLAYNDALTNLPNRQRLQETLDELPDREPATLMVLDVDNMRVINDGLAFAAGNEFLIDLGRRIQDLVRQDDMVARLQGDQFGVLITGLPPNQTDRIAGRLASELAKSVEVEGLSLARSVSIGVAHSTHGTKNLFTEADAALHQAKSQGKKQAVTFDETMRSKVLDRFETEIELRQALDRDELMLYYQPEVDLTTGRVLATEALLRWNHPIKGVLPAGAFIAAAEESGLVVEIGDIVLVKAVAQLAEWHETDPDLEMWINISPAQLVSRDLATQVEVTLLEHGVAPDKLCLEVTEHSVLDDIDFSRGTLERLRRLGVKLALDDFGTGYSSMKQLKSLPITTLKIDMSFVAGLGVSDYDSAIVDAAITLADAFGLNTVAEGIEELSQLVELTNRGCAMGQGYYLSRPADPSDVINLLGKPLDVAITP